MVLINISTPDSQQAHSRFINYLSLETRVKKAESLGAIRVVFINTGDKKDDPSGELSKNVKPSNIPVFFVKNAASFLYTRSRITSINEIGLSFVYLFPLIMLLALKTITLNILLLLVLTMTTWEEAKSRAPRTE